MVHSKCFVIYDLQYWYSSDLGHLQIVTWGTSKS